MVLPKDGELGLTGSDTDRVFRNRLELRWLARVCGAWIDKKVDLRGAPALLPQSILVAGRPDSELHRVITGNCAFTTDGLGVTPGNQFSLIQCSEKPEESAILRLVVHDPMEFAASFRSAESVIPLTGRKSLPIRKSRQSSTT